MIKVVNKHKTKPSKQDFYVGRGSALGNPFTHLQLEKTKAEYHCETREESLEKYDKYINDKISEKDQIICRALNELYKRAAKGDVNLVCFCKPKECHGDIIKKIIDSKL